MISITSTEGSLPLTQNDLMLLQKACRKMENELRESIYDLTIYYTNKGISKEAATEVKDGMKKEVVEYLKLRQMLEDLENTL
jgi:hypothetical protein